MTITASLSIAPLEGDMEREIAKAIEALENYDVEYRTYPMETTIWTEDIDELFAAVKAAHNAVSDERVVTRLKIDHNRTQTFEDGPQQKVRAVEEKLGREATSTSQS
ncbi:MAG: MTH1187 family thiamine-binding protein [Halobacteriaceae archaeon]